MSRATKTKKKSKDMIYKSIDWSISLMIYSKKSKNSSLKKSKKSQS